MLEDVFLKQMRKMLTERFAQLQQKVNVVLATGRIPGDLTVLGPDYKRFLEVYLGEALVQGMISATDVVRRLKRREGFAVTPDPVIPTDAITWMQARVALLGKWPRDLDSQVISVISQGLQQGSSRQVIMAELQAQIFSSYSQARLENIARTETTAAYNHGLLAGFAQPDSGVVAVQYVSILDGRTTEICRARNGLVLPVDSPKLVENTPPLHYQCRSVLSPITEYAMEKLRAGDARYQQRHFGYLDDEFALNPPKTLDEAMAGWEKAPPPQAGFGQLGKKPEDPDDEFREWSKRYSPPWVESLSGEERDSCSFYKKGGYSVTNAAIRTRQPLEDDVASIVSKIDSAIQKGTLEEETVLYRGFSSDDVFTAGDQWRDDAFLSTSVSAKVALRFAQRHIYSGKRPVYLMKMRVPEGFSAGFPDVLGHTTEEFEAILPRGTPWTILEVIEPESQDQPTVVIVEWAGYRTQ